MTSPMTAKAIKSLYQKKNRQQSGKFLVEGEKSVRELLESDYGVAALYATRDFVEKHRKAVEARGIKAQIVDPAELNALGTLEHNMGAIAIAIQKKQEKPGKISGIIIALDGISDPGNLGTIMRIADWYGITDIVCSTNCVDWHNPKAIAASMGSFARVRGYYTDLPSFLRGHAGVPIIGTFLSGTSVRSYAFPESGILVIGSESHGISRDIERIVTGKITIPRIGHAESLNAGIAAAIVIDHWIGSM